MFFTGDFVGEFVGGVGDEPPGGEQIMKRFWKAPKGNKHGAVKIKLDDITFDSKMEARRYVKLKLLRKTGEVDFFLRQTMFDLPGGVKYRCDFQIFWKEGKVTFEDVKGHETKDFIMKKKMVESLYGVEIEVLKKV